MQALWGLLTCGASGTARFMGGELPPVHVGWAHILALPEELQPVPKEQNASMKQRAFLAQPILERDRFGSQSLNLGRYFHMVML